MDTLTIQNARGVTIANRDFNGDGKGCAIVVERGEGVVIERCTFKHMAQAIKLLYVTDVLIRDLVLEATDDGVPLSFNEQWIEAKDIELYGCTNVIVQRLSFRNKRGARAIVPWGPCKNITIADCLFSDFGHDEPARADAGAIYADYAYGESRPESLTIRNNRIEKYPNGTGVYIDGEVEKPGEMWSQVRIVNNTITGCREPWRVAAQQSIVSGNVVKDCPEKGWHYAGPNGVQVLQ